jgi:hypothetical protein
MSPRARGRSLTLFALVLAGWTGGCGGESDRDRVEGYLDDANAIQKRSAPAFRRANDLYRRFSTGDLRPSRASRELTRAERSIRSARAALAKLDPPRETSELHRRLLRVYDLNERMARETTELGRYLPAAAAALRPLGALNRRLRRDLGAAGGSQAQGQALGRYADRLRRVVVRLRRLRPPPVLAATDRARTRRLATTGSLASRLRTAIEARDSKRVAQLLLRFRRVTGSGDGDQPFAGDSLRAYNRRYRELSRAAGAVQQERMRVERSL